jgi:hypothetical protein
VTVIPNLTDNRDGTWTLTGGLDDRAWTIRDCGNNHCTADPATPDPDAGSFAGTWREVLFNCGGLLVAS